MKSSFKNFNRWLAAFGVAAFLMVGGWQVGAGGTDEVFAETEVALEYMVAGSGGGWVCCARPYTSFCTDTDGNSAHNYKRIDGASTCTGHEYD